MTGSIRENTLSDAASATIAHEAHISTVEHARFDEFPGKVPNDVPLPNSQSCSDVPEGGYAAWSTAFGAFLIQFCAFGYVSSFGVYQDYFVQKYLVNESSSAISWIGSVNAFLIVAGGLIAGPLYDRGYFYHLIISGTVLQAFSLFMLSLAKPGHYYQVFLTLGVGSGIAEGFLYVPSMAVISHYFQSRRTLVMAFVASGSSFGAVMHPIMLNNLLNGRVGFANGVRASAGLVSGLLVIACLLMRTRIPPPAKPAHYLQAAKRCSRDLPFIFATTGSTLFSTGFYFPLFYLQLDAKKHNISPSFSFYVLVILNVSNFFGRITSGFIVKYTTVLIMAIISSTLCSILIFGMSGLRDIASFTILGVIYGYCSGTFIAMSAPLVATLTSDISELGARMGIYFVITGVGSLVGSPLNGALLGSKYHWWMPCLFSGLVSLAGAAFFTLTQITLMRQTRIQKTSPSPAPTKA
ncbi:major facilitator superfamily domain-containing protein [Hygrophoropsis aurantiaca]|uniref:Major facilitator superfamily domain-containing protein n=1 Tax=Hygrophoropsis aurantiaca TaxID=72124 RepID=A0ACB8AQ91_9AGAM|nr:major facilitator superfamily domain-containing protein [Hygrophoropsis aurantiaca]